MSQAGPDPKAEDEKIVFRLEDKSAEVVSDGQSQSKPDSTEVPFDGTIIDGRYKLHELIGAGAMAVVYRGEHIATQRPVAIKILSEAGDDESHARFKQEATAILAISHPHIVAAYDFGLLPTGESFLVMDLVEGTTIEKLIDAKTLIDADEITRIAIQVVSGLGEAHRCGILHRDVKPSNIMLMGSPGSFFVKIVDFGLAKPVSGSSELRLTKTGQVVGTPLYMSPEQCAGLDIDVRSDLYSFGCVLYELVTGEPPFLAENALRVLNMHINDKPRPLQGANGAAQNAALGAIILKLLEKDKTKRFQTASELLVALECSRKKMGFLARARAFSTSKTGQRTLLWVAPIVTVALLSYFVVQHFGQHQLASQSPDTVSIDKGKAESVTTQSADKEQPELTWTDIDLAAQQAVNVGDYSKAETLYDQSLRLAKSIRPQYELTSVEGISDLASLTGQDNKRFEKEIEKLARTSLDSASLIKALDAVNDKNMAGSLIDQSLRLATLLEFSGRYAESQKLLTTALAVGEKYLPSDELTKASCYQALAEVFRLNSEGKSKSPELEYRMKAYAILNKRQRDEQFQKCVYLIGRYYNVHMQPHLALPYLKKALTVATQLYGPASKQVAKCCNHLAICYADLHQQTLANASAHEAMTILQSLKPEQLDADAFYLMAGLEQGLHRNSDAVRDYQRSLREYERGPSKNYPLITDCFQMIADIMPKDLPEREFLLKRRLVVLKRLGLLKPAVAIKTYLSLADGYFQRGSIEKQKSVLQNAVDQVSSCAPHSEQRIAGIQSAKLLAEADLQLGDIAGAEKSGLLFQSWLKQEKVAQNDPLFATADALLVRIADAKSLQNGKR